jgi:hypothetical protein
MPEPYPSSADTDAMVARVAPALLALLGDGVPRAKKAIVAALAERHVKDEVVRMPMRLTVTGRPSTAAGTPLRRNPDQTEPEPEHGMPGNPPAHGPYGRWA